MLTLLSNCLRFLTVIVLCCLIGCKSTSQHDFTLDFQYESLGIGPIDGTIILQEGAEAQRITDAVVTAFQDEGFSFPDLQVGEVMQSTVTYKTDRVELSPTQLENYNNSQTDNASMRLRKGPVYGIQYTIAFAIKKKRIDMRLEPTLEHRGRESEWLPYDKQYSSRYFSNRIISLISEDLKSKSPNS